VKKAPKNSRLDRLKYVGWCWSQLPPEGATFTFEDLIQYAKFQLSVQKRVLLKDSIWDQYTDEELLAEYYANLFQKNEDARLEFQKLIEGGDDDEFLAWANKKARQAKEERESGADLEEVEFTPEGVGE
jgi:hypothetical protein